jgi:hypothetical protein
MGSFKMSTAKTLPDTLHLYEVLYEDGSSRLLYGNGAPHAWAQSREIWPNQKIADIVQLDDAWKEKEFN